jgi:hypothetical protein
MRKPIKRTATPVLDFFIDILPREALGMYAYTAPPIPWIILQDNRIPASPQD